MLIDVIFEAFQKSTAAHMVRLRRAWWQAVVKHFNRPGDRTPMEARSS